MSDYSRTKIAASTRGNAKLKSSPIKLLALVGVSAFSVAQGHGITSYTWNADVTVSLSSSETSVLNNDMNQWAVQCGGSYENQCFQDLFVPVVSNYMISADNFFNAVASYHEDEWEWRWNNCKTTTWDDPCSDYYAQQHFHQKGFAEYMIDIN